MSDSQAQDADSGQGGDPICPACRSREARPSRGSYPYDPIVLANQSGSFWRCYHCGARFLGPLAPKRRRRGRGHAGAHGTGDPLSRTVAFKRVAKNWIFSIIVLIATIVLVWYMLGRQAPPEPVPFIEI